MSRKCVSKSKHGKRCTIVITDDESDSDNDSTLSSPLKSLSDIENETDQLCNGLYSDSEENWLEYEPLKSLSDVENEVDAIEEEDVEFTTTHSLHLLHDLGILKGNVVDFLEPAHVNPTPQMGGNQTPQRHNNQVTGTVESNPHHHTCQKKGDAMTQRQDKRFSRELAD